MITTQTMPTTPLRQIKAKVELYAGSALVATFRYDDFLQSIDIDRAGEENKLFGITIGQKAVVKVLDKNRELDVDDTHSIKVYFDHGEGFISPFPTLYVNDVVRDETTNALTITAVCALQKRGHLPISLLSQTNYDTYEFLGLCADILGLQSGHMGINTAHYFWYDVSYSTGANFGEDTTVRDALRAYAEASQTIVYIDSADTLTVRQLDEQPVTHISKSQYFNCLNKGEIHIKEFAHIAELGDNVSVEVNSTGVSQYIYNNPFLELREDIAEILEDGAGRIRNSCYQLYELECRGNYLLEPGDYFSIEGDSSLYCYLFNDSLKYNGGLTHKIFFNFTEQQQEHTNPTSLGEALKQTIAKVDKASQEISLVVGSTSEALNSINNELEKINKQVSLTVDKDEVEILINETISSGVNSVQTTKGFTFNDEGLTVSRNDSDITTTITEDGMTVRKGHEDVLTANNEGVKAIDLHATTYLIVGDYSRFENYGTQSRTACYWIGGI